MIFSWNMVIISDHGDFSMVVLVGNTSCNDVVIPCYTQERHYTMGYTNYKERMINGYTHGDYLWTQKNMGLNGFILPTNKCDYTEFIEITKKCRWNGRSPSERCSQVHLSVGLALHHLRSLKGWWRHCAWTVGSWCHIVGSVGLLYSFPMDPAVPR